MCNSELSGSDEFYNCPFFTGHSPHFYCGVSLKIIQTNFRGVSICIDLLPKLLIFIGERPSSFQLPCKIGVCWISITRSLNSIHQYWDFFLIVTFLSEEVCNINHSFHLKKEPSFNKVYINDYLYKYFIYHINRSFPFLRENMITFLGIVLQRKKYLLKRAKLCKYCFMFAYLPNK